MSASEFLTALGTGSGLPRAVCAPAMTLRFTEVRCAAAHMGAALQGIFVGQGPRALPGSAGKLDSGRCGERTERCRWQRKRSERVAAVKILSVRRKAAQKFWAPQQGHRPLRKRISGCVGEGLCPSRGRPQGSPLRMGCKGCGEESPSHGFAVPAPFRQGGRGDGGRIATGGLRTGNDIAQGSRRLAAKNRTGGALPRLCA